MIAARSTNDAGTNLSAETGVFSPLGAGGFGEVTGHRRLCVDMGNNGYRPHRAWGLSRRGETALLVKPDHRLASSVGRGFEGVDCYLVSHGVRRRPGESTLVTTCPRWWGSPVSRVTTSGEW